MSPAGYPLFNRCRVLPALLILAAAAFPSAAQPHSMTPVLLINGFQSSCPTTTVPAADRISGTFGNLAGLLTGDGAASIDFFDVCSSPGANIENLAGLLTAKIQSYSSPVDVIVHSMGGLIVRAYLQGWTGTSKPAPPLDPKIRKLIFLATPNAGVANAFVSIASFLPTNQVIEMQFGSPFLWSLGTWNQYSDDLRGVDALAVSGTAGLDTGDGAAWDGVVTVASSSLDFDDPSGVRTRTVPYCHTDLGLCKSGSPLIASIPDRTHLSYQLIRSFLDGTNQWTTIAPPASSASTTGGIMFSLRGSAASVYGPTQLSAVAATRNGSSVALTNPVAGSPVFMNYRLPAGDGYTLSMTVAGLPVIFPDITVPSGGFVTLPLKLGPHVSRLISAAGLAPGALSVAADSYVALYGTGLASSIAQASGSSLPYQLGDVSLKLGGQPVRIYYVSPQQINALLPAGFAPGLYPLSLTNSAGSESFNLMIENAVPTLFTLDGTAAAVEDAITGQLIDATHPAAAGEYISLFGTGLGPTYVSQGLDTAVTTPAVFVGGQAVKPLFAGRTAGFPGLDQINVQVPAGLPPGAAVVTISSGNRTSNTVTVSMR